MREAEPQRPPSSIELLLDPAAEAAVRAEWDALAANGMSSLARHTSASNRPHVTLVVRPDLSLFDADSLVEYASFPIILGAPLLFGTGERRVLVRSVVPTAELLRLHATAHDAAGPGEDAPHTAPGEWTPHVTLARRLRVADVAAALNLVGGDVHGHVTSVRRWDPVTATTTTLTELRRP
ncbi:2'-5' RNA ligase family protein [Microbacterium sp. 179-I 3D4 NHS]|uniref:2'-5' RNA ligase family protein n=1 Tax=Microbacterium sp. 179-I 3D4 NHS TaxID=3142381 RepID=UPI0039A16736